MARKKVTPEASGEIERIRERYRRREERGWSDKRYSPLLPVNSYIFQERERVALSLLGQHFGCSLVDLNTLEIGCGDGDNLLRALLWGIAPQNLQGIDLRGDSCERARARLPATVRIHEGDASKLDLPDESFDLIIQFTVLSSVLDASMRRAIADRAWALLRPGGALLSYDFKLNNPSNRDVLKVTLSDLRTLYPEGRITMRRVTLLPPLARRVSALHPALYPLFNSIPFLRTHLLCLITKE